jgi:signal transduction histidine kinase
MIAVRTEHCGRREIVLAVQDSGPGIDPKKLDGIFEAARMGLGLAICRTIIERYGGQLSAYSDGQTGALFQFVLSTQPVDKNSARTSDWSIMCACGL